MNLKGLKHQWTSKVVLVMHNNMVHVMDKKKLSPPRFFVRRKLSTFRGAGTPNWNWIVQGSMRWKLTNLQLTICFEALLPPPIGMEFLWLWANLLTWYSAACPAAFPRVCHSDYQNRRSNLPSTLCRLVPTHSPQCTKHEWQREPRNMRWSLCICVIMYYT